MAGGFPLKRLATWALVAVFLVAVATASVPEQLCEDGRFPTAAEEVDEGDQASLLARMAATKVHDRAAAAESAAAGVNGTAKCNEVYFQGLCYRTCTDMGEMEPKRSPSKCGNTDNWKLIQRCNADGTSSSGAGSAPGISGRPMGGCFGTDSGSEQQETAPNMCTTDCSYSAPKASLSGCSKKFCCGDGTSTPTVYETDTGLGCACPLDKPKFKWMAQPNGVLNTKLKYPCNTGCSKAKTWKMADGVAYCCYGDKTPEVKKLVSTGDFAVECTCR